MGALRQERSVEQRIRQLAPALDLHVGRVAQAADVGPAAVEAAELLESGVVGAWEGGVAGPAGGRGEVVDGAEDVVGDFFAGVEVEGRGVVGGGGGRWVGEGVGERWEGG